MLSEKTYLNNLNEINELLEKIKDSIDKKFEPVLSSFTAIREIHLKMSEAIEKEQEKTGKEWNKISLKKSFFEIYPSSIDHYCLFILKWEDFCDSITKNKSVVKVLGSRHKYLVKSILDKTLNVVTRTMRYPCILFFI